jgi:hypothetical protein
MNYLKLIKYGIRIAKAKIPRSYKVDLEKELLPRSAILNPPKFPNALFRGWMTGSKESADKICEHEFDLLGSGPMKLGKNIDWSLKKYDFAEKMDIKLPWELSRFQFLSTLIKAHEINPNGQYTAKAKKLIQDWILKNPVGTGTNWSVTMEVAIRACNFALAWHFLRDTEEWKEENFRKKFLTSIGEHGKFILRNLEHGPGFNGNHYLADLTGLLFLGILFPKFPEARKWKATAILAIEKEMTEQVYDDGVDFEASIPYHHLVCEFFGFSALLCKENDVHLSPTFMARLEKMFEFLIYSTKPNGRIPNIGDNDDGRLFNLNSDVLFRLSAELFPSNNLFTQDKAFKANLTSKGFNESRIYVMRNENFYCIVDCGDGGQNGHSGHAHNDTLSFELNIGGDDFIVDPGTFVYTSNPEERRRFRGTAMHNTVKIDGEEQNRPRSYTVFSMHNDAIPQINRWDSNETRDVLDAQHDGYKRLSNAVIHNREFIFDKKTQCLEITDRFIGKRAHEFEWNFHFAPGVILSQPKIGKYAAETNGQIILFTVPEKLTKNAVISEDDISPSYGIKQKAKVLTIKLKTEIKTDATEEYKFRITF